MGWVGIRLPNIEDIDLSDKKQVRRLYSYLYKLDEQLRFSLNNIDEENLSAGLKQLIESKVSYEEVESIISQRNGEILLIVRSPASEVDTGDEGVQVRISKNKFEVNVPGVDGDFELNETGGKLPVLVGKDISAPNVSPRYAGVRTITVNPNATAEQMQQGGVFRSLADAFAQLNGRQLEGKVMIVCAEGAVMYGDIDLSGVCGGTIEIEGTGAALYGGMRIAECSGTVIMHDIKITAVSTDALTVDGAGYVEMQVCELASTAGKALRVSGGARAKTVECTLISEADAAVYVEDAASGYFADCKGTGKLSVYFASLAAMGTVPDGGCEDLGCSHLYAKDVVPTGADGQPSAPSVLTAVYTMLNSDSYRGSWSYFSDADIRQGYVSSGRIRGCMWFDNGALRTELAGKSIRQATLSLFAMQNTGRGVAVDVELYGTNMEYAGRSGAPALTTSYGLIGTAEPGEVTTITIPTQAVADLVDGTINALMVYSSDTELYGDRSYSRNYARFAGQTSADADTMPILTVTYADA